MSNPIFGDSRSYLLKNTIAGELKARYYEDELGIRGKGFLNRFFLFEKGRVSSVRNVLEGDDKGSYYLFDFSYTVRNQGLIFRYDTTYEQTVCALKLWDGFPVFELRPESELESRGFGAGKEDIDFYGNPEFSKAYLLRGLDEGAVRGAFTERVLDFFARNQGWYIECGGDWMIVYRNNLVPLAKETKAFLATMVQMRSLLLAG